jgi:hypothetical protein
MAEPTDHQRMCRLAICRRFDSVRDILTCVEGDEHVRLEVTNLLAIAQRLALYLNDGHVSQQELRWF